MKIVRASVYSVNLPTKGGGYRRSMGFAPDSNLSVILYLKIDQNIFYLAMSVRNLAG